MKLLLSLSTTVAGFLAWAGFSLLALHVFQPSTWSGGFSWPWLAIWVSALILFSGSIAGGVLNWGEEAKVAPRRSKWVAIIAGLSAISLIVGYFGYRHEAELGSSHGLAPIRLQIAGGLALVAQFVVLFDLKKLGRRLRETSVPVATDTVTPVSIALACSPLLLGGVLAYTAGRPIVGFLYVSVVAIVSLWAVRLYVIDKTIAASGGEREGESRSTAWQGRVPEKQLHLFEVLGGWPGALLAQRVFRHKSSKASYRKMYLLMIAIHVIAIGGIAWAIHASRSASSGS